MGDMDTEFEQKGNDEIGILAASLNRLKVSLKMAMEMLEGNQIVLSAGYFMKVAKS